MSKKSAIIQPSFEILDYPEDACKRIERIARTCYKSEDKITDDSAYKFVRRLLDSGHHAMVEFGSITVKFVSNRGFSHELVRHRHTSVAQESTRYCNYSKDKFGGTVKFCDPEQILGMKIKDPEKRKLIFVTILDAWFSANRSYMKLLELGAPPDIAREVLPIGVKTELVVQANTREWRYILKLRTSKKAHPRMRELMIPLLAEFRALMPVVFDAL